MISKLCTFESKDTFPYRNLALEEYLTKTAGPGAMILFLWQNRRTVVIGRNQNCFAECDTEALKEDGGFLARRLSGGGAVFHDTGNLNFSFCVRRPDYDVERQTEVILRAVNMLGINAKRTGRNDITADDRKFSGHAYFKTGECCCHHGTLLIDADSRLMVKYLRPDSEKLKSKGVASVRSRICNLKELRSDITVSEVKTALIQALEAVYDLKAYALPGDRMDEKQIKERADHFASDEWLYGKNLPFDHSFGRRFPWGNVTFELKITGSLIESARIWSDSMEPSVIQSFSGALTKCEYTPSAMIRCLANAASPDGLSDTDISRMKEDISDLIIQNV